MKTFLQVAGLSALAIFIFVIASTGIAWQINNPLGNQSTYWTHWFDALQFKSLPQFQEHR
jgi:hypothetical protein